MVSIITVKRTACSRIPNNILISCCMDINLATLREMGQIATVRYPVSVCWLYYKEYQLKYIFMCVFYCNVLAKHERVENIQTCGHPVRLVLHVPSSSENILSLNTRNWITENLPLKWKSLIIQPIYGSSFYLFSI